MFRTIRQIVSLQRLGPPLALRVLFVRWLLRFGLREFAFHYAALDLAIVAALLATGATDSPLGLVAAVVFGALAAVEIGFAWVSLRSARSVSNALEDLPAEPGSIRFPWTHLLCPPLMYFAASVRHERGVVYHREGGRPLRLDVYRPKAATHDGELRPAVIQVHGGGWIFGSRVEQGVPLLNHLAANGWVGFNIDYRLSPRATMPDHVVDVKRAIAWVREHAASYDVDPERICITGGSAGGHLTALAALTVDDPALQPGFEDADTSVAAAVPFYGIYDLADPEGLYAPGIRDWLIAKVVIKRPPSEAPEAYAAASPTHRVHEGAPPFLVLHGDRDTLVPIGDARAFVERLRATSRAPVRFVELPGAEHGFDIFPSVRTAHVVEGIERFLRGVVEPPPEDPGRGAVPSEREHLASRA